MDERTRTLSLVLPRSGSEATGRRSSKHCASKRSWRRVVDNGGVAEAPVSVVADLSPYRLTWAIGSPANNDATSSRNLWRILSSSARRRIRQLKQKGDAALSSMSFTPSYLLLRRFTESSADYCPTTKNCRLLIRCQSRDIEGSIHFILYYQHLTVGACEQSCYWSDAPTDTMYFSHVFTLATC